MKKILIAVICLFVLSACGPTAAPETSSQVKPSLEPEASQEAESDNAAESQQEEPAQEMAPLPAAQMPENFGKEGGLNIGQLEEGKKYMAYVEPLYEYKSPHEDCNQAQGAVFDGEYYYTALIDYWDMSIIVVSDAEGNIVRHTEPLKLDHANSITYVPKENALYIAHCTGSEESAFYTYSVMDKDTLEITKTEVKDVPMTCFAYCEEKDMFYSARWSGETLDIWDGNFEHVKSINVPMRSSLSQGCYATEDGLWYGRSYKKDWPNEIVLYDWDGKLIHEIPFGNLWVELEDIVYIDNENIYVEGKSIYGSGTQAFKITFYEQPVVK